MDRNYFGITDTGKLRDNNEDTFIAEKISGTNFIIACVIDGVGGYTGGEVAAAIARKAILNVLEKPAGELSLLMKNAIADANDKIIAAKQHHKAYEDMACVLTLALIDLDSNQFYYAHVGDTRLYLIRDKSLVKISKDQSFVGFMEDSGRLTEEQAMRHPKRNEINKALGFTANVGTQQDYIETGHSPFLPGDLILLCSDGLSDMVNKQDIINILLTEHTLQQKGTELVNTANNNGGLDNITVVLVKNDKESSRHEATRPASGLKQKVKVTQVNPDAILPSENRHNEQTTEIKPAPKSRKGIISLLIISGFILIAILLYFYWKHSGTKTPAIDQTVFKTGIDSGSTQEFMLQDTLNKLTGNILILNGTHFKSPILLSKSIEINRDSLYLKAEGHITFKSNPDFKGQPFLIAPINKSTLLENITFENFNNAISLQQKGVLLKNVNFIRTDSIVVSSNR